MAKDNLNDNEYTDLDKREYWNVQTGKKERFKPSVARVLLQRGLIEPVKIVMQAHHIKSKGK